MKAREEIRWLWPLCNRKLRSVTELSSNLQDNDWPPGKSGGHRLKKKSETDLVEPRDGSILELALVEVAVMLNAGHTKALHARTVNRALPRGELLERQIVARADLVDRQ